MLELTSKAMPIAPELRVVGVDVGGTNTDAVILDGNKVIGWSKAPTTKDIHSGVTRSVVEALKMANVPDTSIMAIKIGTTVGREPSAWKIPVPHGC